MSTTSINQWGNGLAIRLTKRLAKAAGVEAGTPIRIQVKPGKIVIEAIPQTPTLETMLEQFDPKRHKGEVMAFAPVGAEVL